MSDTKSVQFEFPAERMKEIEEMMQAVGITQRKDYFNNALTLMEWAIKESQAGRTIASLLEGNSTWRVLTMDVLTKASPVQPIESITGVWLRRIGGEDDPNAMVVVDVEHHNDGVWRELIRERLDSNFSHCAHANALNSRSGEKKR